ncbi:MAG: hypothetical protein ACK56J_09815 [Planctomycetota bacterium]|jgi:hypothetical protein|nr:hypothetical protein [Blastopirellula sp.]
MFLPKLRNLRALVFQHLLASEHRLDSEPASAVSLANRTGPLHSAKRFDSHATNQTNAGQPTAGQTTAGHLTAPRPSERFKVDPVAQALAELAADWSSPKLALRAETQLAAADRRNGRLL